jgi:hypothetical protein
MELSPKTWVNLAKIGPALKSLHKRLAERLIFSNVESIYHNSLEVLGLELAFTV